MPIYEFYCAHCNTIYNFFSRSVNTDKVPNCPHCKAKKLERQMSVFSVVSADRNAAEDTPPPIDETKMARAMDMLSREGGQMNEDDPRQAAAMMRKLSEVAGLKLNSGMEEVLSRVERGEDPEKIEAEMGDLLNDDDPFSLEGTSKKKGRHAAPSVDETLYDL